MKLDIYCTNNTITYNIELTIDFGSNFFQIFKLAFKVLGFVWAMTIQKKFGIMFYKIDYDDYCDCILILNCFCCKENVFFENFHSYCD